jgi:hypothetical protein
MLISPGPASRHARLKWLKVVADVGKHDWPHDYPEFINHVEVLVSDPKCFDLARLVVEEFCDDNDDVCPCLAGPDLQGVTDMAFFWEAVSSSATTMMTYSEGPRIVFCWQATSTQGSSSWSSFSCE